MYIPNDKQLGSHKTNEESHLQDRLNHSLENVWRNPTKEEESLDL